MNAMITVLTFMGLSTTIWANEGSSSLHTRKTLTLEGARIAVSAAKAEAKKNNAPGAGVAVVDDGGNVICVERLDGTFTAAWRISIGKARTAAMFGKPTSFFENVIKNGRTPMVALDDFTPLQGGVPILVDGQVVGAIGVSGASSAQQDEELAIAGASAILSSLSETATNGATDVIHIDAQTVNAAFEKDQTLIDGGNERFKVNTSRRDAPGVAEVHLDDTDIFHVLSGSASLVTGGTLSGQTTSAGPAEIRGATIEGGETRRLSAGDVVVVPRGTPHWFQEVYSPLTYYVVKVR